MNFILSFILISCWISLHDCGRQLQPVYFSNFFSFFFFLFFFFLCMCDLCSYFISICCCCYCCCYLLLISVCNKFKSKNADVLCSLKSDQQINSIHITTLDESLLFIFFCYHQTLGTFSRPHSFSTFFARMCVLFFMECETYLNNLVSVYC